MQKNSSLINRYYFILITAAVLAAVSFFRLLGFNDPSGGDGYFYLKQTGWLISHAQFYHVDYSFVFIPLAIFSKLINSDLTAYQIVSCLNYFMILAGVGFFLIKGLQTFRLYQQVLMTAVVLIAFSFQMPVQRISFEFIKNGFALGLFILGLALIFSGRFKSALAVVVFAAMTHKTVAMVVVLAAVIFIIQKKNIKKRFIAVTIILIGLIGLLNLRLLKHFSNFIDQFRFESLNSLFEINSHLISSHVILILFWLGLFLTQVKKIKKSADFNIYQKTALITVFLFSVVPLIPVFGEVNNEIKWRLMITAFCFSFILFSFALKYIGSKKLILSSLLISLSLMTYEIKNESGFPWVVQTSYQVPNAQLLTNYVKPGEELITHHGMEFYIDYVTPIRAKSLLTKGVLPKYQLAYVPEFFLLNPDIADQINQVKLASIGPQYGLFYYEDFQDLMKQYGILRHWKNTFKTRPDFIPSY